MDKAPLRILIVGSGGREHAFAWALSKSPLVEKVFCTPGNGGTEQEGSKIMNCQPTIQPLDFEALVEFAKTAKINLAIPCSDVPIVAAARLEGSKVWAKNFMVRHGIPTAQYRSFTDATEAMKYVQNDAIGPLVVKASGLAAGKGVIMPTSPLEATDAIKNIMVDKVFGQAGDEIVVEELLTGHEISINFITDGEVLRMFPAGQDAERILDGNLGLNTGGMGVYAPTSLITPLQLKEVEKTILQPTIDGMRQEGYPFVGFICIGLMMTNSGPMLIEYNARFGDPQAQTLLPMMDSESDLAEIIVACTERKLSEVHLGFQDKSAVSVVLASKGYPESYEIGKPISIDTWPTGLIFHSGTRMVGEDLLTSGGRVIAVVSMSNTLEQAVEEAYEGAQHVTFEGKYYRSDIGKL
ncbi:phosphoribosylformylglycinamidine cyclo-ligase [Trichoderma harzianum]|uniref:phosphoribosylamine--glycine ligase n=1 Tax=Trichoderma harzianum TaxID=5544 RepID=A0A0F9XH19_TRIHA|nr:phosphoribosylformylglycinamidine cyclo-ligase [Trichoderma harzianum]